MRRNAILGSLMICGALLTTQLPAVSSQPPGPPPRRSLEELLRLSKAAEGPGLAAPFKAERVNRRETPGVGV